MEIEVPSDGCFVASGSNVFDHYVGSIRTRYYLYDGKFVRGSSNNHSTLPSDSYCIQSGDLVYKPELEIYFKFISFSLVIFAMLIVWNLIIKNLWKGR